MVLLIIALAIVLIVVVNKARRKRLTEELIELILLCDTDKIPFETVGSFCRKNNISNSEYHEIRKNLYYERAKADDIHSLKMAAVYANKEDRYTELKYLERAAHLGDVESMYSLGIDFRYDESCPNYPDYEKALFWFEKAAQLGHEKSAHEAARAYRDGEGTQQT